MEPFRKKYRNITVRGVTYADVAAVSAALNVKKETVWAALRKGRLDQLGTRKSGAELMQVRICGRVFPNVRAAAAHFGKKPESIYAALSAGDPDRIGRVPRWNPAKARPIEIGGLRFPSHRAAARALGFANEEYVRQVLRRRSKRGWQRLIGAAMALRARQEAQARAGRQDAA